MSERRTNGGSVNNNSFGKFEKGRGWINKLYLFLFLFYFVLIGENFLKVSGKDPVRRG